MGRVLMLVLSKQDRSFNGFCSHEAFNEWKSVRQVCGDEPARARASAVHLSMSLSTRLDSSLFEIGSPSLLSAARCGSSRSLESRLLLDAEDPLHAYRDVVIPNSHQNETASTIFHGSPGLAQGSEDLV